MNRQRFELAYGDGSIAVNLPPETSAQVYLPQDLPAVKDERAEIRRAMAEPVGSAPLEQLAVGKRRVAILVDDATRPVPTPLMLEEILSDLHRTGIANEQITVVVATGVHRALSDQELRKLTGNLPLKVVNHDAKDPDELVFIGETSRGAHLSINRTVFESDLRILTGDIELHQFVGYGGGAKSVMPGVADAASVQHTHTQMEAPGAGPGRLAGNPIRAEVEEAADILGVQFILNVVLNRQHRIVHAVAGDVHQAFEAGVPWVDRMYKLQVAAPVDVVLASAGGFPKDVNLYQAQKAIRTAKRIVRQGGRILVAAECREGHGSELAYEWARAASSPQQIIDRHRRGFVLGGHKAYQLACDALWADVYLHSRMPEEMARAFFLKPLADSAEFEALLRGAESVAVLPQATLCLPLLPGQTEVGF